MIGRGADVALALKSGRQRMPEKWRRATALLETTSP